MFRPRRLELPLTSLSIFLLGLLGSWAAYSQNILTNRYNTSRTAANLNETILTPANVNTQTFGKLGTYGVDGIIYAQPLYVQNLTIGGASHNVLFVATMHDVLYAFDADAVGSSPLWTLDFRSSGVTPAPIHVGGNPSTDSTVGDTFGIFGTPVIDLPNNRMFLVTHTLESGTEHFRIRSVSILTGALLASTDITGAVASSGSAAAETFIPGMYGQRAALEIVNGQVWVPFGSRPPGDLLTPWQGWIMTYNANTLVQSGIFVTSRTNGNSVWQSGSGPAVDAAGNVYYLTGNGGTYTPGLDLPESLLQMNFSTSLSLKNWYTPDSYVNSDQNTENYTYLDGLDLDLSCNGPVLIPTTNLIAFGSKTADVFVLNTYDLGQLSPNDPQIVQFFHVGATAPAAGDDADRIVGMAYWQQASGGTLFVWPGQDSLHAFTFNSSTSNFVQNYAGTLKLLGEPATALAVSANGSSSGILWAPVMNVTSVINSPGQPGILHAYNASNPSQELWNSNQVASDAMGTLAKFVPPVVVNGKVYIANSATQSNYSAGSVTVYGLKASASPSFTLSTTGNVSANQGQSGQTTVQITPLNGFASNVALSVTGLPTGVSSSFASTTNPDATTLTLSVGSSVSPGSYHLTVTGVSGSISAATMLTLTVTSISTVGGQGVISLNFVGGGNPMGATEVAGVIAKSNWNQAGGATGTIALWDETGTSTGASATWSSPGSKNYNGLWSLPIADTPGNARMMRGYLDPTGGSATLSLVGLPASSYGYDVYVYANGDNIGTRVSSYQISGAGITTQSQTLIDNVGAVFSGTFSQAANSAGNYVKFSIAANQFTLTATPVSSTDNNLRAPLNGLQIVRRTTSTLNPISIDFVGGGIPMASTEVAGVVASANWNAAQGASNSISLPLVDSTGTPTGASVTWSTTHSSAYNGMWTLPIAPSPGNAQMMEGYLDPTAGSATVSVNGLAQDPNGYSVIVYSDGDNASATRSGTYQISGPAFSSSTITVTDAANTNFSGTFSQASNSTGNYAVFSIAGTQFTLTATPGSSSDPYPRAPINGIQIIPK